MAKEVRLNLTNDEKIAQSVLGDDYLSFNMRDNIDTLIETEKKDRFNNEVDKYAEELKKQQEEIESYQKTIEERVNTLEIKPLYNRILVKPFAYNPFQRVQINENGVITDIGGLNPNIYLNPQTGEYEERDQQIKVATVVEVGPECKFLQPGDTVFYMKNLPTPVPFFRQGLWTIKEENIIAVVNEGLNERF